MPVTASLLRPARNDDAPAIAGLASSPEDVRQAAPSDRFPLHARDVQRWLEHERRSGFVLEEDGHVIAYGELNPEPDRPHGFWIGHLMVRTDHRFRGVGRQVVGGLLRYGFLNLRARAVRIGAFDDNPAALACYRACGFREVWRHEVDGRVLVDLEVPRARAMQRDSVWAERRVRWGLAAGSSLALAGVAWLVVDSWQAALVTGVAAAVASGAVALGLGLLRSRSAHRRRPAAGRLAGPTR
jgi:RimJ/RimL family protein N-acetyltransferase